MADNQTVSNRKSTFEADTNVDYTVATEDRGGSHIQITGAANYASRIDDVGGGVSYVGKAAPGTATSSAAWLVSRLTEVGDDLTIEWAPEDSVWDDRLSLTYT